MFLEKLARCCALQMAPVVRKLGNALFLNHNFHYFLPELDLSKVSLVVLVLETQVAKAC